jgi:hypothetical protein
MWMEVDAPITKDDARLALAIKSAHPVLDGGSNVFDEASTFAFIYVNSPTHPTL